ncbi:MAG TPA: glycosyl transferase family 2 [Ruminococcaceae bacterium]|nr:glycosyl transferase family 2 [Oscillospiraceae bacterium]
MTILIPAYEPNNCLIRLVHELKEQGVDIVVVNDGSGPAYDPIFQEVKTCGCTVISHAKNEGKGCALKSGFSYILEQMQENDGVVTADADGQHTLRDILRVAYELKLAHHAIILGARRFSGHVPMRSIVGNVAMHGIFTMASGISIADTQTGLRGIPATLLPLMLRIKGTRFEYEINMLLDLANAGYSLKEIYIDTIYTPRNESSHFRPLIDSLRVLFPTLRFCTASLAAAVADYFLLFIFQWCFHSLLIGVILARTASSSVQYSLNRYFCFHSNLMCKKQPHRAIQYYLLVVGLLIFNYLLLKFFVDILQLWLPWAKVITECLLFFISYTAQRFVVFKRPIIN